MASGQKRRQAEHDEAAATNKAVVAAQMQPSAGEKALSDDAMSVMNYKGDYAGLPGLIMPTFYSKLKGEQAQQNRGAATFGAQNADPNLLAGLNSSTEANASQLDALGFQDAVSTRQGQARGEAATAAGLQGARLGTLGGQTNSYAQSTGSIAAQPGFWQQFLFQAMNNAQGLMPAGFGGGGQNGTEGKG